ncbi:DNA methyltransferase [Oenococcus oeni]|uniref:DNA methyltransferase n=1 Tax=Oenococcus oeni TaxID=1247 RepID=UPI0010B1F789|nr:DNA methyltransferase [Oenococcus oeni]SYW07244.1 putative restriction type II methylase; HGT island [Oenococcus oeni]
MAITEYEDQIKEIVTRKDRSNFIYDFLSVYERIPRATITKLRKGINNLAQNAGEVYLKNKLYFKETSNNLMQCYADLQDKIDAIGSKPRYIIVTDFKNLLAKDTKTQDTLDIEFTKLPQYFEFFLSWNGIEKADFDKENPADVRAAERFAKLYDVVVKDNPHATRKGLNLLLIRILFCLFAEDTNIFKNDLFTNRVKEMTAEDGSDFNKFIADLFGVLDFEKSQRDPNTPSWVNDFPYVDGDLFKEKHESLKFSAQSRKLIIDAGELLKWDQINPDILGSMIQAVASEDSRSHLGMHYTSVPNIMKVIKPLFLDGLREDFEAAKGHEHELQKLYDRIGKIKFMDPACGSGNFLIVTYKELRQLEIDIIKELNNMGISTMYIPSVTLDQFYGIEIDDFACDVTRLSLWIAEHQMNVRLHKEIADAVRPTLPLQHAGAIINGNALRLNWNEVMPCGRMDEAYLFGNPPYLGAKKQQQSQKNDLDIALDHNENYKKMDYITAWFYLGAKYISKTAAKLAFVTTNSIVEGEQAHMLWPRILQKCEIILGYKSFLWSNNAKHNAGVTVSIIGMATTDSGLNKRLYDAKGHFEVVSHISPYLVEGNNLTIASRVTPISDLPHAYLGCLALDKGNFVFDEQDFQVTILKYPKLQRVIKKYGGSSELIHSKYRHVLWLNQQDYSELRSNPIVAERVRRVGEYRRSGGQSARGAANTPYAFFTRKVRDEKIVTYHTTNPGTEMYSIVIPRVSSQNRLYVPMGIVGEDTIVSDSATVIYDAPIWLLGLLESHMDMVWLNNIGGKLKTDFRFSAGLVYNTFPVPDISVRRRNEIENLTFDILDTREESGKTLGELYGSPLAEKNPKPMDQRLLEAHQKLDEVIDRAYKVDGFKDDSQRLSLLLKMYEERIQSLEK